MTELGVFGRNPLSREPLGPDLRKPDPLGPSSLSRRAGDPAAPSGERLGRAPEGGRDPFDPAADSRPAPAAPRRDTGPIFGGPILGSGPEVARGPRREPTGRHELIRTGQFAAVPALPTIEPSAFERAVDTAQRWRSPLGLALAALMTVGVVAGYQRWTAGEEIAASGNSRSGLTSAVDADELDDDTADTGATAPDQQVGSEVDELDETTVSTGSVTSSTDAPASPTTTPTTRGPTSTSPTTTPTAAGDTSVPPDSATSQPPSATSPESTTSSTAPAPTTVPPEPSTTASTPPAPVRTEAEAAALVGGAAVAGTEAGFSGSGYVTGLDSVGDGVSFTVDSAGGTVPFAIGYSAGPVDGAPALRTASILVDGERRTSAQMDATATFSDWTIVSGTLELPAGQAVITIEIQATDSGQINVDYIEVG